VPEPTDPPAEPALTEPVVVPLASSRWRHFAWALVGLGLGVLFLALFGPVGKALGALIAVGGGLAARRFARTLAREAGAIRLGDAQLELPAGPCLAATDVVPLGDVRYAYLLRRSTPFLTSGPVLVVETSRGPFAYPRDWFETDADQRRLAAHINRRLGLP
jgi:hypothetical protein